MTFEWLIEELKQGKTLEEICNDYGFNMVECYGNKAYINAGFECFLSELDAYVDEYDLGVFVYDSTTKESYKAATIFSEYSGKTYELYYSEHPNRFGDLMLDEMVMRFDNELITEVDQINIKNAS